MAISSNLYFQKLELLNFFGNEIGYYTAMTAVIFLLTIWIDTVTKWFNSLISWSEFFKAIQSYYVKVMTPVASFSLFWLVVLLFVWLQQTNNVI